MFASPSVQESAAVAAIPLAAPVTAEKAAAAPTAKALPAAVVFNEVLTPPTAAEVEPVTAEAVDAAPVRELVFRKDSVLGAPDRDLPQILKVEFRQDDPDTSQFAVTYRSLRRLAALGDLPRRQDGVSLIGIASTYNPYRDGPLEGHAQTASGEYYDAEAWTAAIQIDLRADFGGVRYGRLYRPVYALVESGRKQAIVKINDVGPLKPGRIIDLNERSMRYFDPFLRRGLLQDVRVTLLPGEDWTTGPVGGAEVVRYAGNM